MNTDGHGFFGIDKVCDKVCDKGNKMAALLRDAATAY